MRGLRWKDRPAATLVAAVAAALALAVSCRTVPARPTSTAGAIPVTPEFELAQPVMRVAVVTDASRVSIGAESGIRVYVRTAAAAAPRRVEVPVATFRRSGSELATAHLFRVQVASLADERMARDFADRARTVTNEAATVAWNEATRTFQVRAGTYETRDDASGLARRLGANGFPGAWVVEEARGTPGAGVLLLESREEMELASVVPARAGEAVTVDSVPYRGFLEIRPGEGGALTVVNVLHLEDYLKGVVPNELSPVAYPQIEALKAQAIAARTYAIRNRGQFQAKGYDLCATPACQVYRGKSTENPLSDRAVEETRGLVARWHDAPIDALYTSTCGGHTEDGANMFEGEDEPYLKGVICAPERKASGAIQTRAPTKVLGDEEGLGRDVALLVALGVVDEKTYATAGVKGSAGEGELRDWTARLVESLRRKGCDSTAAAPLTRRASFFEHLVDSLCWDERGRRLLAPEDEDFLLRVEDAATLKTAGERLSAAVLVQEGVISPFSDNTLRGDESVSRIAALRALARVAEKAGAPGLLRAEVDAAGADELRLRQQEGATESHRVDPAVRLFRSLDGSRAAVSELSLVGGDKVSLVEKDGRVVFLEAEQSRLGAAADRSSRYYRWEVRLTPTELERAVARYGAVGRVSDVEVRRTGVSGRVVELAVRGSTGELPLKGLKIRWALGLRENLFVVDRERDAKGGVARFVFTGKGWGHGVGLCQVGAYGMAQAGATYEKIVRHYYSGVEITKAY
ncbi:MAG TPA: SpoIID/LytB domain-containing protein [Vicinamibacteria bacterium]|nr:SpoIID/LytB domain-containing protein [Vicinamibacteria bacterium]